MEATINGAAYRVTKMDPFRQFHVIRRMGPLFPSITGFLKSAEGDGDKLLAAGYIAAALGRLSDPDATFILNACLATCARKQGTVWAAITDAQGSLMFDDINMPTMLELAWEVLKENYGAFIPDLLVRASAGQVQK